MKKLLSFCFLAVCFYISFKFIWVQSFQNPYPIMCRLVTEKIFLDESAVKEWASLCHSRSHLVTPESPRSLIIRDMNNVLALLKVSHLEVFDPSDVQNIWKGQSQETGIVSDFVDGELVVFKVYEDSPAFKKGIQKWDIVKSINQEQPSSWTARTQGGDFLIQRSGKIFSVRIEKGEFLKNQQMKIQFLKAGVGHIEVPSFRAEFFEQNTLEEIFKKTEKLDSLIIDFRGNEGGNFVAGLRFISLFSCKVMDVGEILRKRLVHGDQIVMPNDLNDQRQLDIFYTHQKVILRSFPRDKCFQGKLSILVDNKTSSVAEMVAQALRELRGAKIFGSLSRGQLLVGVWYPLNEVATGVEISIPEAAYVSQSGHQIEGGGVHLDQTLYYDLGDMKKGIDSWIMHALNWTKVY